MDSSHKKLSALTVGAIGVVFGDIGTSPLYALKETFRGHHPLPVDMLHIYGVLSLVFWTFIVVVTMKYVDTTPVITGIKRASTPGRRMYYGYSEIPRVLNGLGIAILSASKGLMKDQDCRRNKLGGELVCTVW